MEKIKILYCTNVNEDLEALKTYSDYVRETKPDMNFVAGNLIDEVLTEEELESFLKLEKNEYNDAKKKIIEAIQEEAKLQGIEDPNEINEKIFPYELFDAIMKDRLKEGSIIENPLESDEGYTTQNLNEFIKPETPLHISSAINNYLKVMETRQKYVHEAEKNMKSKYEKIKEILASTNAFVLPGNYDGKCLEDIMQEKNLHKKFTKIEDIPIAGYGSSDEIPTWIPQGLREDFNILTAVNDGKPVQVSEAGMFMMERDPDIALLHKSPLREKILNIYMNKEKPYLLLTGDLNEDIGVNRQGENTHIIMPGKLGAAILEKDTIDLKTFVEIDMLKGEDVMQLEKVTYHQIKDDGIVPFMEYNFDKNGNFQSKTCISEDSKLLTGVL